MQLATRRFRRHAIYIDGEDQVDFFKTTVEAYKRYPTYDWLAKAGTQPSNTTTFTLSDVVNVLTKRSGAVSFIGCSGDRYNTVSGLILSIVRLTSLRLVRAGVVTTPVVQ